MHLYRSCDLRMCHIWGNHKTKRLHPSKQRNYPSLSYSAKSKQTKTALSLPSPYIRPRKKIIYTECLIDIGWPEEWMIHARPSCSKSLLECSFSTSWITKTWLETHSLKLSLSSSSTNNLSLLRISSFINILTYNKVCIVYILAICFVELPVLSLGIGWSFPSFFSTTFSLSFPRCTCEVIRMQSSSRCNFL